MVIRLACNFDKWNFNLVCFGHHFERVYIYTPKCSQQEGVPVAFIAETHKAIIKTYTLGCSFLVSENSTMCWVKHSGSKKLSVNNITYITFENYANLTEYSQGAASRGR